MKILDKYLIKQFIQTFLFGLLAFTLLFVVIDMMENLDDFIDQNVNIKIIFHYYFVFIPEIIRLMIPVAVLLSALFTVGKLSTQNELAAIKASGVSLYRLMIPFIGTAFFISLFSIYFGGYVAPIANKQKVQFEKIYMNKGVVHGEGNVSFQDSKNRIVTMLYFNNIKREGVRVSIQEFDLNNITDLITRYDSQLIRFDTLSGNWLLLDGVKRTFDGDKETAVFFDKDTLTNLKFRPDDVVKKQAKLEELTLPELEEFANDQLQSGNDPTRVYIEYHSRFAFAFASLVVVLFGMPISANKRKGGMAVQFGKNLAITFVYLGFMKISQAFGKNGILNPLLTAWFANIIFLISAIYGIMRMQK